MKLAICLSGGISEAVPFVCRVTAVPAAGHLETNVPDKEVFMTVLSVDKEMRLHGWGWWLRLMSGGRSNVPAMAGSERIMNSKSTGKFEWKCVSGVLVLGIRLDRN